MGCCSGCPGNLTMCWRRSNKQWGGGYLHDGVIDGGGIQTINNMLYGFNELLEGFRDPSASRHALNPEKTVVRHEMDVSPISLRIPKPIPNAGATTMTGPSTLPETGPNDSSQTLPNANPTLSKAQPTTT
ncbi:hypothetical protein D9758_003474 [Tetrapyrgos nigripes]|uniref:Uncharacterized protein n=1 Tax=Tetrapyrgos nigripes TaxID=182062 RepID=A0A8H5LVZ7_9AGAR|nr:hypothetical protein D9758_003474 [Tetrapyrgos nigripes]